MVEPERYIRDPTQSVRGLNYPHSPINRSYVDQNPSTLRIPGQAPPIPALAGQEDDWNSSQNNSEYEVSPPLSSRSSSHHVLNSTIPSSQEPIQLSAIHQDL
jgi:hypothetical protein